MKPVAFKEVVRAARRLSAKQKIKLIETLRRERLDEILTALSRKGRGAKISFAEITASVESIRGQQHGTKRRSKNRN